MESSDFYRPPSVATVHKIRKWVVCPGPCKQLMMAPHVSSCTHTLCVSCLKTLIQTNVPCPQCNAPLTRRIGHCNGLPVYEVPCGSEFITKLVITVGRVLLKDRSCGGTICRREPPALCDCNMDALACYASCPAHEAKKREVIGNDWQAICRFRAAPAVVPIVVPELSLPHIDWDTWDQDAQPRPDLPSIGSGSEDSSRKIATQEGLWSDSEIRCWSQRARQDAPVAPPMKPTLPDVPLSSQSTETSRESCGKDKSVSVQVAGQKVGKNAKQKAVGGSLRQAKLKDQGMKQARMPLFRFHPYAAGTDRSAKGEISDDPIEEDEPVIPPNTGAANPIEEDLFDLEDEAELIEALERAERNCLIP